MNLWLLKWVITLISSPSLLLSLDCSALVKSLFSHIHLSLIPTVISVSSHLLRNRKANMVNPKLNTELISYDWLWVDECQVIQHNPNINTAKGEEQSVDGKHSPEQTCHTMTLQQEMSFYRNTAFKKRKTERTKEKIWFYFRSLYRPKKKKKPCDFWSI